MKTYEGVRGVHAVIVTVTNEQGRRPLPLQLHLRNHSPTGFEWGYGGSGPAQLALAILVDLLGTEKALEWYQPFKWRVIAGLQGSSWTLTEHEIRNTLQVLEGEGGQRS